MNTKQDTENQKGNRFLVYENGKNKWVIEDTETTVMLIFSENKVQTEGYFATFKDDKVMTDTRLIGQTTREMHKHLEDNYKHLLYGNKKK